MCSGSINNVKASRLLMQTLLKQDKQQLCSSLDGLVGTLFPAVTQKTLTKPWGLADCSAAALQCEPAWLGLLEQPK
jgi:hypothetical protein